MSYGMVESQMLAISTLLEANATFLMTVINLESLMPKVMSEFLLAKP